MPKTATIASVFLASPSDVQQEREIVSRVIADWNARQGAARSFIFDLLKWETSISAGFGYDGQDVVNSQIADTYDLLLVIMWTRLGSPTPRSRSGTYEEYDRALARYRNQEEVEIAILFKDAPLGPRDIDVEQLKEVIAFESKVQSDGAFSKRFRDDEGLKFEINLLLDRLSRSLTSAKIVPSSAILEVAAISRLPSQDVATPREDEEELGLYDISENLQHHSRVASKCLDEMTLELNAMTNVIASASAVFNNISSSRSIEPGEAKPIILKVAAAMDRYSDSMVSTLPTFSESSELLANDIRALIDVFYDFVNSNEEPNDNLGSFRSMLEGLIDVMDGSIMSFEGMLGSTKGLQRTTAVFNKAKRRNIAVVSTVIEAIKNCRSLISQALVELDALIKFAQRQHLISR